MTADTIPQLTEALQRRTLALFLGADLPCEVTGLPSRADLARELALRHGLDETLSLAEVAQRVARGGERFSFTGFLRNELDTTGKTPQPLHRNLVELVTAHRIEALITTTYDNLLELAFQQAGAGLNRIVQDSDVHFVNPDRPTLIKLYGDAQQPNTLLVTEDDHYDLWRDRDKEEVLHLVRTVLSRNTVLFLGYNLADPDFHLLWREVLHRTGRFARIAYAIWPDLPETEARMWRDRRIEILDADPLGILDESGMPAVPPREASAPSTEFMPAHAREEPPPPPAPDIDPDNPPIATIRQLLMAVFTAQTLPRFCRDRPGFRPVLDSFGTGSGKADMVDRVLEHCEMYLLWNELLAEVAKVNPRQYARFVSHL